MTDILKFLKQIRTKRRELGILENSIREMRFMLMPSGIRYDLDKVQTSPEDRLSQSVADLVAVERRQKRQIDRLMSDIAKAEKLIETMPTPEYRELIRLRYVSGGLKLMTWEQVAEQMGYSADHVRGKLHGKAIAEARRVWSDL
jgi:DNA-directed RNA polymerase sigma subunit (sigma70/sigma32)